MNKYRNILLLILIFCCTLSSAQKSILAQNFNNPPAESAPWAFWYWMYGAVSKAGITADMEAMKQAGLGGVYLMPIKGTAENNLSLRHTSNLLPNVGDGSLLYAGS